MLKTVYQLCGETKRNRRIRSHDFIYCRSTPGDILPLSRHIRITPRRALGSDWLCESSGCGLLCKKVVLKTVSSPDKESIMASHVNRFRYFQVVLKLGHKAQIAPKHCSYKAGFRFRGNYLI